MNEFAPLEIIYTKRQKLVSIGTCAILPCLYLLAVALAFLLPDPSAKPLSVAVPIVLGTFFIILLGINYINWRQVTRFRIRVYEDRIEERHSFRTCTVFLEKVAAFQRVMGSRVPPYCILNLYDANEKLLYRSVVAGMPFSRTEAEAMHRFWAQVATRLQERDVNEWTDGTLGVGLLPTAAQRRVSKVWLGSCLFFCIGEGAFAITQIDNLANFILWFGVPARGELTFSSTCMLICLVMFFFLPVVLAAGMTLIYRCHLDARLYGANAPAQKR